jgi:hypothetical protein
MKRVFALALSAVIATSLLAIPCFAEEAETLPDPLPGVTATEQPEEPEQPENPDEAGIQLYDVFPGGEEAV